MTTDAGPAGSRPPIDRTYDLIAAAGASGRSLRGVLADLEGAGKSLTDLIRDNAVPRRTVEDLLEAAGPDLDTGDDRYSIRRERLSEYRERFDFEQLRCSAIGDPMADLLARNQELVQRLTALIQHAPRAEQSLDHVAATAETVVRRALWLGANYDLAGSRVLCVGDHDLTSLAIALVCPETIVTVADIDERVLEFITRTARQSHLNVTCVHADFRFELPPSAVGSADLVVTDPPYTPEGVRLFLARGIQGLRDIENGRILMAYGFSARRPTLGRQVQESVLGLHLAIEAILPHFNRYHGAQAVGSAADWYVCRPTAKSPRLAEQAVNTENHNIYTHGNRSLEAAGSELSGLVEPIVREIGNSPILAVGGWPKELTDGHSHMSLGTLLRSGVPKAFGRRDDYTLAVDLTHDPGSWLLRVLFAANTPRIVAVVPNNHRDIVSESAQHALQSLIDTKYSLRILRSVPDSRHAFVVASRIDPDRLSDRDRLTNHVLNRTRGKLGNIWRDALTKPGRPVAVTRNEARDTVKKYVTHTDLLDVSLIELGRDDIATVLADVRNGAESGTSG